MPAAQSSLAVTTSPCLADCCWFLLTNATNRMPTSRITDISSTAMSSACPRRDGGL